MEEQQFIGSYAAIPFWAGDPIATPAELAKAPPMMAQLQEFVFNHNDDSVSIRICKDGMILLRVEELATNPPQSSENVTRIDDLVLWWARYLDVINLFHLLLACAVSHGDQYAPFSLYEITRKDAFGVNVSTDGIHGMAIASESVASAYQWEQLDSRRTNPAALLRRCSIPISVFRDVTENLSIVGLQTHVAHQLANISRAISQYRVGN